VERKTPGKVYCKFQPDAHRIPPALNIARYTVLKAWRNQFATLITGIVNVAIVASVFIASI
jgi:hypothetical protein